MFNWLSKKRDSNTCEFSKAEARQVVSMKSFEMVS